MNYNYYSLLGMEAYEHLFKKINLTQLQQNYYQSMNRLRSNDELPLQDKVEYSIRIIDAYNCLRDSKRKKEYDNKLQPFCVSMLEKFNKTYLTAVDLLENGNTSFKTKSQLVDRALRIKQALEELEQIRNDNMDFDSYLKVYLNNKEHNLLKKR